MAAGEAKSDLLWVIGMVVLLAIAWFFTGGPGRPEAVSGPFIESPDGTDLGETYGDLDNAEWSTGEDAADGQYTGSAVKSPWSGQVELGKGTAASAELPNDEYVTIKNESDDTVTISGWSLKNGDDERSHLTWSGQYLDKNARWAVIPNGLLVFNPDQATNLTPITLAPGDQAIVLTGRINRLKPIAINSSFKTNICTGYLDDLPNYDFTPSLSRDCPDPSDELGVESLPDECYRYVNRLSRCHMPKFDENEDGDETIDGRVLKLSAACEDYVQDHFSYQGCLKYHAGDANFLGDEWRIFLRTAEMWRADRGSITLYDNAGRLVDRLTY